MPRANISYTTFTDVLSSPFCVLNVIHDPTDIFLRLLFWMQSFCCCCFFALLETGSHPVSLTNLELSQSGLELIAHRDPHTVSSS